MTRSPGGQGQRGGVGRGGEEGGRARAYFLEQDVREGGGSGGECVCVGGGGGVGSEGSPISESFAIHIIN